jgi:glycosyltransferase involved in cell wall biosynthesis
MRAITVAHFIHSLELGGAQQVVRTLAGSARPGGPKHRVYAGGGGVFHDELVRTGTDVRIIARRLPKFDPVWLLRLGAELRRDPVDLVHCHLFGDSLHGTIAARIAHRPPVVITLHNAIDDFTRIQRAGYAWMLPRAARVVACSEAAGRTFRECFGDRVPVIDVIPNGIVPSPPVIDAVRAAAAARVTLGVPADAKLVGAIGRLVPQKGFSYLLSAFRIVADRVGDRARLVIVGSGPDLGALQAQIASLGLEQRVLLSGFRNDVREIMPAFDVVAFSSLYEGLPVALLEAMAAGVAVVATSVPGLAEVLVDRQTALMAPARSPEALADALCYALREPEVRRGLGASGRELFGRCYTADRMVERYEAVYGEVMARSRCGN